METKGYWRLLCYNQAVNYPNLKFDLNINFDLWTAGNFLKKADDLFTKAITDEHPELIDKQNDPKFINKYVQKKYGELNDALEKSRGGAEKDWKNVKKGYFETVETLFTSEGGQSFPWPKGEYICFMSIFNCNPRFIDKKEFQVYYKHVYGSNEVCMHEMLHFIFYAYIENEFPNEYKNRDKDYIWKLSEVFNDIILRLPEFVKLTGIKKPDIYAQTQKELEKNTKLWDESNGIKDFIHNYLKSN